MKRILVFILLCFSLLPSVAYAHGGGTDSRGGHTDESTGGYHYHHGYSAHDHYDMDGDRTIDCPYDFEDKTGSSSGSSSSHTSKSDPTPRISLFTTPRPTATPEPNKWSSFDPSSNIFFILGVVALSFGLMFLPLPFEILKERRAEKQRLEERKRLDDWSKEYVESRKNHHL